MGIESLRNSGWFEKEDLDFDLTDLQIVALKNFETLQIEHNGEKYNVFLAPNCNLNNITEKDLRIHKIS